jgi:hypothetical protein
MENLAHSASFHSGEKIAPSKSGIKHLTHVLMRFVYSKCHKKAPVSASLSSITVSAIYRAAVSLRSLLLRLGQA